LVSLFSVALCFAAPPPSAREEEVLFYPPQDRSRPRPLFVMLHGMCGAPEHACPYFAPTISRYGWLVCPRAAQACDGGGTTWSYREREQTVERAVERVVRRFPGEIDESAGRTLIGFSLGAFVASDVAQRPDPLARYRRVLLVGARVLPEAARLRRAGIARILLAAGQYDMTYGHMAEQTRRLVRAGFPARFIDLGPVGHRFPADFGEYLEAALSWLDAPPPPS
jgi:predicted esterase